MNFSCYDDYINIYFSFQKDDITICFIPLRAHQMLQLGNDVASIEDIARFTLESRQKLLVLNLSYKEFFVPFQWIYYYGSNKSTGKETG